MAALGERFRAAREARGLSLSDVSEQIRIRSVYLAAIEDENWPSIGAPVYIRGFLRTYARFLGLDPEEVVAAFNGAPAPAPSGRPAEKPAPGYTPPPAPSGPVQTGRRSSSLAVWAAAIVAVFLVAFVVYNEYTMHQQGAPATVAATAEPSASPEASPADGSGAALAGASISPLPSASPADEGPNTLALTLTAPSWLRITVDGNVSMEGTFPAGTSKTFHGRNALVRVGNAGGVEIRVDGKDVGKLGKSGDVIERSFTL